MNWLNKIKYRTIVRKAIKRNAFPHFRIDDKWYVVDPFCSESVKEKIIWCIDRIELVDFNTLEFNKVEDIRYTARDMVYKSSFNKLIEDNITHLKTRQANAMQGYKYNCNNNNRYITRESYNVPGYIMFLTETDRLMVPRLIVRYLECPSSEHAYVKTIFNVATGEECDIKPIVRFVDSNKHANQTTLSKIIAIDECPGLYTTETQDIIIDIAAMDNSAEPIVNLGVFIKIITSVLDGNDEDWKLNLDRLQLRVGMNPLPSTISELVADGQLRNVYWKQSKPHKQIEHSGLLSDKPTMI